MALTREQKKTRVDEAEGVFANATGVVFVTYNALSLADMNELRDSLFDEGIKMRVIPKRLLRLAAQNSDLDIDATEFEGQVALVWGDDVVAPAAALAKFAKDHENLELVAGMMNGDAIDAAKVNKLASLPSREQLLGQLVSVLAGPMTGVAGVLAGVPRSMVYALKAVSDTKTTPSSPEGEATPPS